MAQTEDFNVHEIVIDPDEEILLEGEIVKFKPGIERNFISRWVQLSTRSFRYYKNHYHSICYLTRPIAALPLHAIQAVRPFVIENSDYKRRDKHLYQFMFEVALKQDYEDIFFFRDFEVNGLGGNSGASSPVRVTSPGRSESRNSRASPHKYSFHNSTGNGGQIIVTNQLELNGQVVPTRMVFISPKKRAESPSQSARGQSKVTRIVQGHLMPVRDQNRGLQKEHYLEDQNIVNKEFGEPQVNLRGEKQSKL